MCLVKDELVSQESLIFRFASKGLVESGKQKDKMLKALQVSLPTESLLSSECPNIISKQCFRVETNLSRLMNNVTGKHVSIGCNQLVRGYRHSEMHLTNYSRLVTFRVGRVASRKLAALESLTQKLKQYVPWTLWRASRETVLKVNNFLLNGHNWGVPTMKSAAFSFGTSERSDVDCSNVG